MDAAGRGDVDTVQQVLEVTAKNVDQAIAPFNMSALHVAAANGEVDAVNVLLKGQVEITFKDDLQRTPLHLAAYTDHADVVKLLKSKEEGHVRIDVNATAKFGITPLHLAIVRDAISVAEILLAEQSVDRMAQTEDLLNILHMAADKGHHNIVSLLARSLSENELVKLMSASMVDRIQRTPLHYAARAGQVDVVRLFFQQPFSEHLDVNAKDADGLTSLHLASRAGHTAVVVELFKRSDLLVNSKARNQNTQASLVAPTDLELEYLPRPDRKSVV